jgi:hypothetical protein
MENVVGPYNIGQPRPLAATQGDAMNDAPIRIKLSRARGWRMPSNTVKVDRTGWFGNPYLVDEHGTRAEVVEMFRAVVVGEREPDRVFTVRRRETIRGALRWRLKGQNLACWCPLDEPCHADVLLKLAADAEAAE